MVEILTFLPLHQTAILATSIHPGTISNRFVRLKNSRNTIFSIGLESDSSVVRYRGRGGRRTFYISTTWFFLTYWALPSCSGTLRAPWKNAFGGHASHGKARKIDLWGGYVTNSHMSLCMVSNRSGIILNRFISLENSRDTLLHTGIYIIGRYVSLGGEEDLLYLDHLIFSDNSGLTILFAAIKSPQEKWIWSHGKSWEGQKNRSLRGGMRSTYTLHFILAKNTLNTIFNLFVWSKCTI